MNCLLAICVGQMLGNVQFAPAGFRGVEQSAVWQVTKSRGHDPEYQVSYVGTQLRVETRLAQSHRMSHENAKFRKSGPTSPFIKMGPVTIAWVLNSGLSVENGSMTAFDVGEWGGGIVWFGPNGKDPKVVSQHNTQCIAKCTEGVFAVQSLDRMDNFNSQLVRVLKMNDIWTTQTVTDLHVSVNIALWDGHRFLFTDGNFVSTLETTGVQREIYRGLAGQFMGSMALGPNGEV